jgi:hypothetical protein
MLVEGRKHAELLKHGLGGSRRKCPIGLAFSMVALTDSGTPCSIREPKTWNSQRS